MQPLQKAKPSKVSANDNFEHEKLRNVQMNIHKEELTHNPDIKVTLDILEFK